MQVCGGLSTGQNVPSFFTFNTSLGQSGDKSGGQACPPATFFAQNPQPSVLFRPLAMAKGDQVTDPLQFSQQCRDKPGGLTYCLIRHVFASMPRSEVPTRTQTGTDAASPGSAWAKGRSRASCPRDDWAYSAHSGMPRLRNGCHRVLTRLRHHEYAQIGGPLASCYKRHRAARHIRDVTFEARSDREFLTAARG